MKIKNSILVLLVGMFCQSCMTLALWRTTNPHEYVWIDSSEITEKELQQRNVAYLKHEKNRRSGYLVEKNSAQKLQDYSQRIFGTPVTLVMDGVEVIIVGILSNHLTTDAAFLLLENL